MAIARIEWFRPDVRAGCLRVWDDDGAQYGEPYDWSATVTLDEAIRRLDLHGVDKLQTRDQHRAVMDLVRANPIDFLAYERRTVGRIRHIVKRVRP